jgi:hypothetical protein
MIQPWVASGGHVELNQHSADSGDRDETQKTGVERLAIGDKTFADTALSLA